MSPFTTLVLVWWASYLVVWWILQINGLSPWEASRMALKWSVVLGVIWLLSTACVSLIALGRVTVW